MGVPRMSSSILDWDFPVHKNHPTLAMAVPPWPRKHQEISPSNQSHGELKTCDMAWSRVTDDRAMKISYDSPMIIIILSL